MAIGTYYKLLPPEVFRATAKDFFVYSASFLPLAASGTGSDVIQINSDADFLVCAGVRTGRDVNGAALAIGATVNLIDSGSGRQIFDDDQDVDNIFGTAQLPSVWPYPKLLTKASSISVNVRNLTATDNYLRIALLGFKIFSYPAEQ